MYRTTRIPEGAQSARAPTSLHSGVNKPLRNASGAECTISGRSQSRKTLRSPALTFRSLPHVPESAAHSGVCCTLRSLPHTFRSTPRAAYFRWWKRHETYRTPYGVGTPWWFQVQKALSSDPAVDHPVSPARCTCFPGLGGTTSAPLAESCSSAGRAKTFLSNSTKNSREAIRPARLLPKSLALARVLVEAQKNP
jgi:hypothetical protein